MKSSVGRHLPADAHFRNKVARSVRRLLRARKGRRHKTSGIFMQRNVMIHRLSQLWRDQSGVLTFEWIILTSIVVVGLIAAMGTLRDALVNELGDLSGAY